MTPQQEHKLDKLIECYERTHFTLYGVEGDGGLVKDVRVLQKHKEDISMFKAKLIGIVTGVSIMGSVVGSKLATFFKGSNN